MSSGPGTPLSPTQVRLLRRLAVDPQPVLARRAVIVLAEHRRRTGTRNGPTVVVRQTAAKWYARFAQSGAEGLRDLPRAGRPATHGDEALRAVLTAPLFLSSLRWTSHTVAGLTGQSQTAVVRAWRHAYGTAATPPPGRLPQGGLGLVAARVDAENSVIVLAARAEPLPAGSAGPFMRSPRRAPLQVLLAADLLAPVLPAPALRPPGDPASFVDTVRRRVGTRSPLFVISRRPVAGAPPGPTGVEYLVVTSSSQWQGLLEVLVRRCTATPHPQLVSLQQRLQAWAQGGREPFEWLSEDTAAGGLERRVTAVGAEPRPAGQVVADAVLATVMQRIATGRLAAGDRITESSLSRAVPASRAHVREALLTLASNGLVDLEPHRGARVPAPQVADVVETYAVRRALGALVVRRAVHGPPEATAGAERALAVLTAVARTGDAWATGEADIAFQDALALSTAMRRIPRMFVALSAQIRLFTTVMGVRYAYSVPQMVRDDTALLHHVKAREEAAALKVWHAKMDDAVSYMVTQLGSSGTPSTR